MKTKPCALCAKEDTTLFRIQIEKGKIWMFVCEACCTKVKENSNYKYGGTWKGYRH
jgi:protein-arginine kinase activator protein McsA